MTNVRHLYNPHGCEITCLSLVRDDDVLIAAPDSESFKKPGNKNINKEECAKSAFFTFFKECLKICLKALLNTLKESLATAAVANA